MKESLQIQQRLRSLLKRFYDGSSSPEEEREIQRLLAMPECATEEFAEDRELFNAMSAAIPAGTTPPATLGAALEKMADRHFRPARRQIPVWLRWSSAAAVAACLLGIILFPPIRVADSSSPASATPSTDILAEKSAGTPGNTDTPVIAALDTPAETTPAAEATPAPQTLTAKRHRGRKAATATAPAPDDIYDASPTNLTPEQAARISEAALMAVVRTMASAEGVCRQTDDRIGTTISLTLGRLIPANTETENKI